MSRFQCTGCYQFCAKRSPIYLNRTKMVLAAITTHMGQYQRSLCVSYYGIKMYFESFILRWKEHCVALHDWPAIALLGQCISTPVHHLSNDWLLVLLLFPTRGRNSCKAVYHESNDHTVWVKGIAYHTCYKIANIQQQLTDLQERMYPWDAICLFYIFFLLEGNEGSDAISVECSSATPCSYYL